MTLRRPTATEVSRYVLWASLGFNLALLANHVRGGHLQDAAWQTFPIIVLTTWLALAPRLYGTMDAKLGEAVNTWKMSAIALEEMQRQHRAGTITMTMDPPRERQH